MELDPIEPILSHKLLQEDDTAFFLVEEEQFKMRLGLVNKSFSSRFTHALAIKTNPQRKLLQLAVDLGFGLEAASLEEIKIALSLQRKPKVLIFDSPVKTLSEIDYCSRNYPNMIVNANSLEELERFEESSSLRLGLRINPGISTSRNQLYNVSSSTSKFGVPIDKRDEIIDAFMKYPLVGLHMHSGSSQEDTVQNLEAMKLLFDLQVEIDEELKARGVSRRIEFVDVGGGIHPDTKWDRFEKYGSDLSRLAEHFRGELYTEFGQFVQRNSMSVYSRIEYAREMAGVRQLFIHVGADMFVRDCYVSNRKYSYRIFNPEGQEKKTSAIKTSVVGPLCFAGDVLEEEILLPSAESGDWIKIERAGANTYGLWSRHCSRNIPAVVAFNGDKPEIIQLRTPISF